MSNESIRRRRPTGGGRQGLTHTWIEMCGVSSLRQQWVRQLDRHRGVCVCFSLSHPVSSLLSPSLSPSPSPITPLSLSLSFSLSLSLSLSLTHTRTHTNTHSPCHRNRVHAMLLRRSVADVAGAAAEALPPLQRRAHA